MTTAALVGRRSPAVLRAVVRWLPALGLAGGLAAIVAARWWAATSGLDPLAVGAGFGAALAGLALVGSGRLGAPRPRALAIGGLAGIGLVGLVLSGAAISGGVHIPGLGRPAAPFLPWALITILVASAEERLLRGRLFDALRRLGGLPAAVLVTTVAFALMHVPLYGWHVVPLDLAVGLVFAGLRLATGSVAAPAAAHVTADIATWWL
jgi:membrane protease YdiL (CAAX protease family)